ncbi:Z-DNA-binding protein 1 [Hippopotamus amphibius kiboko]|uniref:Z-DNA-binding protein 1 n=1 Tax=Hippopotamus amphibius kiboko TaxID=575201 RepID=UPI00259560D0|nr:Z-DNA-binding protein 1 [Hippopotamus amphibius kiboko]
MAEAPADPGDKDLEQRILEVLRDAGSPVKTAQLVKKCQVPKLKLNQVLHRMKKESKGIVSAGPATWCLGDSGTKEVVPAELAERPQQDTVAVPRKPGPELSEQQEKIYRFLEEHGPHKPLKIAQALGKKTAKEVNPDLYEMRNKHLLDLDPKSNSWAVYQPGGSRNQSIQVIYQQNPINMISQKGPNSHISIKNSEGIQIGHKNVINMTSGENGSTAPFYLPPTAPADSSTQDPLDESWGAQDIWMEKSVLRRVQMGHGNEMNIHGHPAKGPAQSTCGSPPGPEASIEIQTPEPGLHSEEVMVQRVHIRSCFLEDTTVGNSNKMTIDPGAGGPGGAARPAEPGRDADPPSGAAPSGSEVPPGGRQAAPDDAEALISEELAALTLDKQGPRKRSRRLLSDTTAEPVSPGAATQSKQLASGPAQEEPGSQ